MDTRPITLPVPLAATPVGTEGAFASVCRDFLGKGYVRPGSAEWNHFRERFLTAAKSDPEGISAAWRFMSGRGVDGISLGWQVISVAKEVPHLVAVSDVIPLLSENEFGHLLIAGLVELLGAVPDPASTPALINMLFKRPRVAEAALVALGKVGDPIQFRPHYTNRQVGGDLARVAGWRGEGAAFDDLRAAYADTRENDDRANILEAMGTVRHSESHTFIIDQLRGGLTGNARAAALQSLGTASTGFERIFEILFEDINHSNLDYKASALFAALLIGKRKGFDFLPSPLRDEILKIYGQARTHKRCDLEKAGDMTLRSSFGSMEELRSFIHQDYEFLFCIIPEPNGWTLPEHHYEFMVRSSESGIQLTRYGGEANLPGIEWPVQGDEAERYLREIGLIGSPHVVLILRGDKGSIMAPPLFAKLGLMGHSHPAAPQATKDVSENDYLTFTHHDMSLRAVRRFS